MKAIEAAEYSDIIYDAAELSLVFKEKSRWFEFDVVVDIEKLKSDTYIPLVPKKIYKIGDQVTFLEALNSGMCFRLRNEATIQKFDSKLKFYDRATGVWRYDDGEHVNSMSPAIYTLCDDPSIPPKPTLESLPAWTRCKVEAVNHHYSNWDVIKKPNGSLMHHYTGNDFEWVNVKLVSIYNPKTEQWEDV